MAQTKFVAALLVALAAALGQGSPSNGRYQLLGSSSPLLNTYYLNAPTHAHTGGIRARSSQVRLVSVAGRQGRQLEPVATSPVLIAGGSSSGEVISQSGLRSRPAPLASKVTINRPLPTSVQTLANGELYAEPIYEYAYEVNDDLTGDVKSASERRNGARVDGSYSVNLPDGTVMVTTYYADETGYHATVVRRNPATGEEFVVVAPDQHYASGSSSSSAATAAAFSDAVAVRTQFQPVVQQVARPAPAAVFSTGFVQQQVQPQQQQILLAQQPATRFIQQVQPAAVGNPFVTVLRQEPVAFQTLSAGHTITNGGARLRLVATNSDESAE